MDLFVPSKGLDAIFEKIKTDDEFVKKNKLEAEREIANLRLQTIASLPHLAIFSDEAHHTYGQSLDKELKKVRKTLKYEVLLTEEEEIGFEKVQKVKSWMYNTQKN